MGIIQNSFFTVSFFSTPHLSPGGRMHLRSTHLSCCMWGFAAARLSFFHCSMWPMSLGGHVGCFQVPAMASTALGIPGPVSRWRDDLLHDSTALGVLCAKLRGMKWFSLRFYFAFAWLTNEFGNSSHWLLGFITSHCSFLFCKMSFNIFLPIFGLLIIDFK